MMRQVVFAGPGKLEWREAPDPTLHGPGEALVRPLIMGRCDLDRLYLAGRMPLAAGEPIGHEIIGEIIALGEGVKRHKPGDRVIVPAQISCGVCRMCRAGRTGRCEAVPLGSSYGMGRAGGFGGGLSDIVRAPFADAMLVPLPHAAVTPALMGLADMATDAWRAVGPQLEARPGGSVLVVSGLVPVIAIYAAGLAVTLQAGVVDFVDPKQEHRQAAAAYGARVFETIEAAPEAFYDIVVDAAGDEALLLASIRRAGPAGQLTSVAPPFVSPPLPLIEMYYKGLDWRIGRPDCRAGHDHALPAWAHLGFKPEIVGPKVYAYEEAIEAWLDPSLYVAVERR